MRIKPGFSALSCFGLAAAALSTPSQLQAQTGSTLLAHPEIRISQPVSNSALVMLKHNTSPMAQARFDQGVAPSSTETGRIQLLLRPSAAQKEALREYLGGLQNPNSPDYHKWLTPQTYGTSFGISDADLEKVEAWLQGEGFTVNSVPASRNMITFSGTFAQVAQAFHTSIHTYLVNGVKHYSNATDPSIPAALAPVVQGISPLNDFHPKPMHTQPIEHTVKAQAGRLKLVSEAEGSVKPQLTVSTSGGNNFLLLAPGDAATIYDSPNSLNSAYTGGSTEYNGQGVNIGVVGVSDLPVTDYQNYRKLFLNETNPAAPTEVLDGADPGEIDNGDSAEALIDTELSAALAPKATIYYYYSADSLLQDGALSAAIRAVQDNNVDLLSISFGACEYNLGPAGNAEIATIYQQAAAQGITVLVSTGDSGSAACDVSGFGEASGGLAVSGFASTPYNIAVGGTDFDVLDSAFSSYVGSGNTGSGTSSNYFDSALRYIPENPWNDSISNSTPGSYTANTAEQYTDSNTGQNSPLITGAGGGASAYALCAANQVDQNGNCTGLSSGYPTPSFQTGVSIAGQNPDTTPTGVRYLPDVSLFASSGNLHNASWAICADANVNGTGSGADCEPDSTGNFGISAFGGTSTASPAFAGVLAMVVQSLGSGKRLGLANNILYNLNTTDSSAGIFHDVTAGNISQPCVSGSTDCGTNGFLQGWNAAPGYDLASGLGSVDISKLVSAWDSDVARFTPTTVTLTANGSASTLSFVHGTSVTLASSVSPSTATGAVSVVGATSAAGAAVNEVIPITGGTGSATVNDLPGGQYAIHAYYQGDVKDAPSTSSPAISVNITPESSTPYLSINEYDLATGNQPTSPTSAPYGEYGFVYVQPANSSAVNTGVSNGFAAGTVTLNTGSGTMTQTLNSQGVAAFPLYDMSPGNYSYSAQYSGDSSYQASSTTTAVPFTISKATTTVTIHTGNATASTPGNLQVELQTDSAGSYPTQGVSLSVNGTSYTGTVADETLSDGAVGELVTYSVPSSALSGSVSLQASYAGDTNYSASASATCVYAVPAVSLAASSTHNVPRPREPRAVLVAAGLLGGLLFLLVPARRRAWKSLLVLGLVLGIFGPIGAIGCGGTSTQTKTPPTTTSTCSK